jgi:hypothetical protein
MHDDREEVEEADSAEAGYSIRKLVTVAAAIAAAVTAAKTDAVSATTITAAVKATVPTATIDTARRWNIAAGRRRRRNVDLATATAPDKAAAPTDGTIAAWAAWEVAECFGLGRNGGGSE